MIDLQTGVLIILLIHCLGLFLAIIRVITGPDLSNRLAGLEYIGINFLSFLAIYCILSDDPVYLDIGIVLALITFLGTIALARYIELSAKQEAFTKRGERKKVKKIATEGVSDGND